MPKPFTMDDIVSFLQKAAGTADFVPRWQTGAWSEAHRWLYIGSDLASSLAYVLLAVVLASFCRRRAGARHGGIFLLLRLFILSGVAVHLLDAAMFWWPAYRLLT